MDPPHLISPFNITTQIKYSNQLLSTGAGGVLKVLEHGDQAYNGRDPPICEQGNITSIFRRGGNRTGFLAETQTENGPF